MLMTTFLSATAILLALMLTMSKMIKTSMSNKKSKAPFECGFSTMKAPNLPFSLQFFMISTMFIIFDIEISMILSMMKSSMLFPPKLWMKTSMAFMLMMQLTLLYEMSKSSMKWIK